MFRAWNGLVVILSYFTTEHSFLQWASHSYRKVVLGCEGLKKKGGRRGLMGLFCPFQNTWNPSKQQRAQRQQGGRTQHHSIPWCHDLAIYSTCALQTNHPVLSFGLRAAYLHFHIWHCCYPSDQSEEWSQISSVLPIHQCNQVFMPQDILNCVWAIKPPIHITGTVSELPEFLHICNIGLLKYE